MLRGDDPAPEECSRELLIQDLVFRLALDIVLREEGGYVSRARARAVGDPGGATNRGITQRTLERARETLPHLELPEEVAELTQDQTEAIYRELYWRPVSRLVEASPALALFAFDAAVHHGPARSIRWIQELAGVPGHAIDGIVGPQTLEAVRRSRPVALLLSVSDRRRGLISRWVRRNPRRRLALLGGLLGRVARVTAEALAWECALEPQRPQGETLPEPTARAIQVASHRGG